MESGTITKLSKDHDKVSIQMSDRASKTNLNKANSSFTQISLKNKNVKL